MLYTKGNITDMQNRPREIHALMGRKIHLRGKTMQESAPSSTALMNKIMLFTILHLALSGQAMPAFSGGLGNSGDP